MSQGAAPVVDLDEGDAAAPSNAAQKGPSAAPRTQLDIDKSQLAALLARGYTEKHPDIQRLKARIAKQEAAVAQLKPEPAATGAPAAEEPAEPKAPVRARAPRPTDYVNPVLQSQLKSVEEEIEKHKQEQGRLKKLVGGYQAKLEAIPVREQQIAELVRDYEISKVHYTQLLGNQLSAETATQLEVRQKGEKFSVLDPAQPAERPSSPNRQLLNSVGAVAGLGLGFLLALMTEFLGTSITAPEQITAASGLAVLEVIPIIRTHTDKMLRKRRIRLAAASGAVATVLAAFAFFIIRYRGQGF